MMVSPIKVVSQGWWKLITTRKKEFDVVFVGFMAQTIILSFLPCLKIRLWLLTFYIHIRHFGRRRKRFKPNSLMAKVARWFDKATLMRADHIVGDTKARGRYFAEDLGADKEKLIVLYLKADRSIYFPRKIEKKSLYKDKFVVLYFGSILPLQGVDVVLDCARAMEDYRDIFFVMIGPLKDGDKAKVCLLTNIEFIDWLPQGQLARHIAMADLCLSGHFNKDIGKARRTIAGKTYIYRAMEKPVILGENSANRELFRRRRRSIFCRDGRS